MIEPKNLQIYVDYMAQHEDDFSPLWLLASGYESRATFLARKLRKSPAVEKLAFLVLGFADYRSEDARIANDNFYAGAHMPMSLISSSDHHSVVAVVYHRIEELCAASKKPVLLNVDYSCLPRAWYCSLAKRLLEDRTLRFRARFWYAAGLYSSDEFPTAGVSDFQVFSGKPSLVAEMRTHLFGLGFDRARSHAIWSVLDPQRLVCYYAKPGTSAEYDSRVEVDNVDVLRSSDARFIVPIADFLSIFSTIRSKVIQYTRFGDVVLVPDGPKPLVMASSLIPLTIEEKGVSCFHVRRRRVGRPLDVPAHGDVYGFQFDSSALAAELCSEDAQPDVNEAPL